MTVTELMAELAKYPAHYIVMLVTPASGGAGHPYEIPCFPGPDYHFVRAAELETNMSATGPVVKLLAEDVQ